MRFLAVLVVLVESATSAQLSPARYLLMGALENEQVQLELTLSETHASGRFISAPTQRQVQRLRGRVAQDGEVRLRGAGLDLRGHLPEAFAEDTQAFSGTLADGQPFSLTIVASYLARRVTQGPFLEVSSETPFSLAAPWRRVNMRPEGFVRAPAARFTQDAQELVARGELDYS